MTYMYTYINIYVCTQVPGDPGREKGSADGGAGAQRMQFRQSRLPQRRLYGVSRGPASLDARDEHSSGQRWGRRAAGGSLKPKLQTLNPEPEAARGSIS